MKAKLVNEALKDILKPRPQEEVQKEIIRRLNQYKIPVANLFQRAQHSPKYTKLVNFIEKNHFKPKYLIPYNSGTRTLLHHFSVFNKSTNQVGPPEWNLYKYGGKKAISAFSNEGDGEVLVFGAEFLDDAIQALKTLV